MQNGKDLKTMMLGNIAGYSERELAAYQAGLSNAAMICDAMAAQIIASNKSHHKPSKTNPRPTKIGQALADVASKCGQEIMNVRAGVEAEQVTA